MARFNVGDKVMVRGSLSEDAAVSIIDVSDLRLTNALDSGTRIYRFAGWAGWVGEGAIIGQAKTTHRIVLDIEDPSALKALTGATIVSDTVI